VRVLEGECRISKEGSDKLKYFVCNRTKDDDSHKDSKRSNALLFGIILYCSLFMNRNLVNMSLLLS
jgi:hypothetical protein